MGSLLEGIEVQTPKERAKSGASKGGDRKGVKLAVAIIFFVIAGGLLVWHFMPAKEQPVTVVPADEASATPSSAPSAQPAPAILKGPQSFTK